MNRKDRRAADSLVRRQPKNTDSQIIAVHEAGHAVAKVLSIGELGYDLSQAIDRIEIGSTKAPSLSFDRNVMLHSQGVTYGRTFSYEIEAASFDFKKQYLSEHGVPTGSQTEAFLSKIVECGQIAGADIGRWFQARIFDAVSGPIAEAIFSNRSFHDVWQGYQSENDRLSIMRDARISRILPDNITPTIDRMAALSAHMMENPSVWAAVLALTNQLPRIGRMMGAKAVSIITSELSKSELDGMFACGVNRIRELEKEIISANVAIAISPNGSQSVIKGKQIIEKMTKEEINNIDAESYFCRFSVFGELLWRAFGDGAINCDLE